jgi:hypothetical protein
MSLLTLVQNAAKELGLTSPATAYASSDAQVVHLVALAQREGSELMQDYDWQVLTKEKTFLGVPTENQSSDPTRVLLHFNGSDTSTTITDSSPFANSWSAAGNAQIDTAQSKFGSASLLCDGTGDYVTAADDSDFSLGIGDFTVDMWVRPAADDVDLYPAGQGPDDVTGPNWAWWLLRNADNTVSGVVVTGSTATTVTSTSTVLAGSWAHIALVKASGVLKLFINGVQEGGNIAHARPVNDSTSALRVGSSGEYSSDRWNGWIDEFRLSVGVARWTSDFTPSTSAYDALSQEVVPTDLDRFVPETFFNRTRKRPVFGPISAQDWQFTKGVVATTLVESFRQRGNGILITPTPTANDTYAYEYISKNWCQSSAGTGQTAWAADTDTGILPESLMTLGVIWRFLRAKGFDYAEAFRTYELAKAKAQAKDGGKRRFNLAHRTTNYPRAPYVQEGSWNL